MKKVNIELNWFKFHITSLNGEYSLSKIKLADWIRCSTSVSRILNFVKIVKNYINSRWAKKICSNWVVGRGIFCVTISATRRLTSLREIYERPSRHLLQNIQSKSTLFSKNIHGKCCPKSAFWNTDSFYNCSRDKNHLLIYKMFKWMQ